jgi:hypothetical protein
MPLVIDRYPPEGRNLKVRFQFAEDSPPRLLRYQHGTPPRWIEPDQSTSYYVAAGDEWSLPEEEAPR